MPELPEVETIRRQLEKVVLNKKIEEVIIKDKRIIKGISEKEFRDKLEGKSIAKIERRGKVLILQLVPSAKEGLFLIFHLRISGWLIFSDKEERLCRIIIKFSQGEMLNFCDQRVLGEVKLVKDWQELSIIERMGPEPLDLKKEDFVKLFTGKKTSIKPLLMDQNFLAGVGNVYAQESLFCAGIHPERKADKITEKELEKLYSCLISILKDSIDKKGSSVDTYRQLDGKGGGFVPYLNVYQREGEPCLRCKTIIERKVIGGRGTGFCPNCQEAF